MDTPDVAKGSRLYWRLALLLPVAGAGLGFMFEGYGIILAAGFVFVALPYAAFAALTWWQTGRLTTPRQFLLAAAAAPVVLAAIAFVMLVPVVWLRSGAVSLSPILSVAVLLPWILFIGYLYVAVAALGYVIGLKLRGP